MYRIDGSRFWTGDGVYALQGLECVEYVSAATAHNATLAHIELRGLNLELGAAGGARSEQHACDSS
jgi:hypothetical protein